MADAHQAEPRLDFNALYLDTNVLVRSGWPDPSVGINNLLMLAKWWGVPVFLSEPVLIEAEEHWIRAVQKKANGLQSAVNQFERIAKPIDVKAKAEHIPIERLSEAYRTAVKTAMDKYRIHVCPFTNLSVKEMFKLASRYALPFEFEQEGKGFQDAVILSSILQHLKSNAGLTGILITADGVFGKVKLADLEAGFSDNRLRILDIDSAFALLWEPYWDETVLKPYAVERENAKAAAEAASPMLKDFIQSHLSESMLKTGMFNKALKILSVDEVKVMYVQTPLPDPAKADREVQMAIAVSAECTVVVEKDYSFTYSFLKWASEPSKPVEEEEKVSWFGGVEVTAEVVGREFRNLSPVSLLSVEELGSDKWWK